MAPARSIGQSGKGIDRIGDPPALDFYGVAIEVGKFIHSESHHLEPIPGRGDSNVVLMGRQSQRNESHPLQPERLAYLLRRAQVPVMNWIKGSP